MYCNSLHFPKLCSSLDKMRCLKGVILLHAAKIIGLSRFMIPVWWWNASLWGLSHWKFVHDDSSFRKVCSINAINYHNFLNKYRNRKNHGNGSRLLNEWILWRFVEPICCVKVCLSVSEIFVSTLSFLPCVCVCVDGVVVIVYSFHEIFTFQFVGFCAYMLHILWMKIEDKRWV